MSFFQRAVPASKARSAVPEALPWVEKYRPKTMRDITAQEEVVQVLSRTVESRNLPHLLFYGPPGTGKTTTILALAREMYGHESFKSRVLELNASDERGIQVVREKVKNFARIAVAHDPSGKAPPYKLVILDEADAMTSDAQAALRRTMETYSKVTRFCLICNYVSRIIEPLASRCAKFRFKPLNAHDTVGRLQYIGNQEGLRCTDEAYNALVRVSGGDLRRAITFLQSAHRLHPDGHISVKAIEEMAGAVPEAVIDLLWSVWQQTPVAYDQIIGAVSMAIQAGYSAAQILLQMHDRLVVDVTLSSLQKSRVALVFGEVDKRLVDGADEHLQLLDTLMRASRALTGATESSA
ncbi:P-loop containing nucleoside triphosphate hydrolase protein [Thamnocephalis sphaerospora]|uniref:P-loop containing nucleoside triphosphate hydrolase protein n=1 Tax=Thamnocephalis sphaerospora TaxID=78915 RepID=A0A4P9XZK3_9FUNG|nr:P-loop containing nucleoside triphosphate hydrolase protein [Thamnocephalis sphaerospora]|eukprot:RKP10910.1 P-loop containing nucleoside triphosphate hydrolase protein [Thamnocephalis sphaerospora]